MQHISRVLFCGIVFTTSSPAQTLDQLGQAIVYLEMNHTAWERSGTNNLEVWYHAPGATNFLRKIQPGIAGTGFLVNHGQTYIVTAAHVVGERTNPDVSSNTGTVFFMDATGARQPVQFTEIRNHVPGARWFFHPKADVALHPYWRPTGAEVANLEIPENMIRTNRLELLTGV
jgi:S1-C subfamily serine protease